MKVGLEAESHASANVMLETLAPPFTTLGAVHRLPVSKHNGGFAERVLEGKFTAPISAARQLGVGTWCVEARTTRKGDIQLGLVEAKSGPYIGVVANV